MNFYDRLNEQRKKTLDDLRRAKEKQMAPTENFLNRAMQRLEMQASANVYSAFLSTSFQPTSDKDYELIKNLHENCLIDEAYLKELCEKEGIEIQIFPEDQGLPTYEFSIDFNKTKSTIL